MPAGDPPRPTSIGLRFEQHGITLRPEQQAALERYLGLLTKWNKTLNLTALKLDPLADEAIDRLLVEPVLAAQFVSAIRGPAAREMLVDVGSGSGSPAIPLKISVPGVDLVMVESRIRKSAFLRDAIRLVGLERAEVQAVRLEQLVLEPRFRESVTWVSVRAVRADSGLWQAISAILALSGRVLWFRSQSDAPGASETGYLPAFQLEDVRPLIPERRSELAILRRRGL